jgi:tripartite ATP-independent transporter DctP family solute receptor
MMSSGRRANHNSRRNPVKKLLAVTLLAFCALLGAALSAAAGPTVIKAGLIDPPGHIDTRAAEKFAELVAQKTGGAAKVEIYPASQLGFAMDMLQGMKLGTIEMFIGGTTWLGAFEKDFWVTGSLYVFNDQDQARAFHQGPMYAKLGETLRTKHGIRLLAQNWDRGPRNFIATVPLRTVEDLKGLKIRVPEQKSWIEQFKLAGAAPTPIALAETFTGLQQGVVQCTEQASNWLYFNKYHTIAKNLTRSKHNYEETGVMISEAFFQKLPADVQKALAEAALEVAPWHNEQVAKDIEDAEKKMAAEGENIIDPDIPAWQKHFRANFDKLAADVGYSKEVVETIKSEWK